MVQIRTSKNNLDALNSWRGRTMGAHSKDVANPPRGSDHLALDCRGMNFYRIDRSLQELLDIYMDPKMRAHMEPHLDRLGELAGGRLDELASARDKHPPVLHPRDRFEIGRAHV